MRPGRVMGWWSIFTLTRTHTVTHAPMHTDKRSQKEEQQVCVCVCVQVAKNRQLGLPCADRNVGTKVVPMVFY